MSQLRNELDRGFAVSELGLWESTLIPAEGGTVSRVKRHADYKREDRGYDTPCWIWQRYAHTRGYGYVTLDGVSRLAHREYFRRAYNVDITGIDVHHKCHVTLCVNPDHLEAKDRVSHLADHKQEASTLEWEDIRAIRSRAFEGAAALAREYGVTHQYISLILTNQRWVDAAYAPASTELTCARPGCDRTFTPRTAMARFCGTRCRNLHNNRVGSGYYERRGIAA
jgi:hypothetical protein